MRKELALSVSKPVPGTRLSTGASSSRKVSTGPLRQGRGADDLGAIQESQVCEGEGPAWSAELVLGRTLVQDSSIRY